jgi:hypothetical protein
MKKEPCERSIRRTIAQIQSNRKQFGTHHRIKVGFLTRAGSRLELGSLDLRAGHLFAEKDLSAEEQFVVVTRGIRAACQTRKAVKIELTLEGSQLGLTKVSVQGKEESLREPWRFEKAIKNSIGAKRTYLGMI